MIQAMCRFPEHADVQKNGCGALRNLAFDMKNVVTIMELDGAQVVLDAMRRHSGEPSVQQNACGDALASHITVCSLIERLAAPILR